MLGGSDKDKMTSLLPVLFNPGLLAFGPGRKKRATEPTEHTEQKLVDKTQTLLLVAQHMAERKPWNMQAFHINMLHLPMIAVTCKTLQAWLMHDSIWLPILRALMYKRDFRLSETFVCLIFRSMVLQRKRNPELQQVTWKMACMLNKCERVITTNLWVYSTFQREFSWLFDLLGRHNKYYDADNEQVAYEDSIPIYPKGERYLGFGMCDIWRGMPLHLSRQATELFQCKVTPEGTLLFCLNTTLYLVNSDDIDEETGAPPLTVSWGVQKQHKKGYWVMWDTSCDFDITKQTYVANRWGSHEPGILNLYPADLLPRRYRTPSVEVELDTGDVLHLILGVLDNTHGVSFGVPFARLTIDIGTAQENYLSVDRELKSELVFKEASLKKFFDGLRLKLEEEKSDSSMQS